MWCFVAWMLEPEIAESLTIDDISVYAKRIPKKEIWRVADGWIQNPFIFLARNRKHNILVYVFTHNHLGSEVCENERIDSSLIWSYFFFIFKEILFRKHFQNWILTQWERELKLSLILGMAFSPSLSLMSTRWQKIISILMKWHVALLHVRE